MQDFRLNPSSAGVMYDVERPAEFNTPVEVRAPEDSPPLDYPDPNEPDTSEAPQDDVIDDAVKVEVVSDLPRPAIVEYSAQRYAIPAGRVTQIAGSRRNRTRLTFYSETTDTDLRYARRPEILADHAPVVPSTFAVEMLHNTEVWVTNTHATDDRHICVVDEFIIED